MIPKFRAWHKELKHMCIVLRIYFDKEYVDLYHEKQMHLFGAMLSEIELMQWTGLQDRNGKDIYIGDIVKMAGEETNDYLLEVLPSTNKLGFYFSWIDGKRPLKRQEDWDYEFSLVGNLYANPELLNKD